MFYAVYFNPKAKNQGVFGLVNAELKLSATFNQPIYQGIFDVSNVDEYWGNWVIVHSIGKQQNPDRILYQLWYQKL